MKLDLSDHLQTKLNDVTKDYKWQLDDHLCDLIHIINRLPKTSYFKKVIKNSGSNPGFLFACETEGYNFRNWLNSSLEECNNSSLEEFQAIREKIQNSFTQVELDTLFNQTVEECDYYTQILSQLPQAKYFQNTVDRYKLETSLLHCAYQWNQQLIMDVDSLFKEFTWTSDLKSQSLFIHFQSLEKTIDMIAKKELLVDHYNPNNFLKFLSLISQFSEQLLAIEKDQGFQKQLEKDHTAICARLLNHLNSWKELYDYYIQLTAKKSCVLETKVESLNQVFQQLSINLNKIEELYSKKMPSEIIDVEERLHKVSLNK